MIQLSGENDWHDLLKSAKNVCYLFECECLVNQKAAIENVKGRLIIIILKLESFFLYSGFFACKFTQIENFCSPYRSILIDFDLINER